MEKILTMLGEIKGFLSGAKAAADQAIADAGEKIKTLTAAVAEGLKTIEARDATIKELTAANAKLSASASANEQAAKDAAAKLTEEAKRTDATLSAMGVDPKTIPAAGAAPQQASGTGMAKLKEWDAIADPAAKTTFYRKHKAEIDSAFKAIEGRLKL